MSVSEESLVLPEGTVQVGPAYDFIGYTDLDLEEDSICESVYFDEPVMILIDYDPDLLPDEFESLAMWNYNVNTGTWTMLPPEVGRVAEVGEITGMTTKFSTFAVLATLTQPEEPPEPPPAEPAPPTPPLPPAQFVAGGLDIVPSKDTIGAGQNFIFVLRSGERATVSADIANTGGQSGTYTADLKINGTTYETRQITLDADASETVVFSIAGLEPGRYTVELAGLSGEFQTSVWYNGWLIAGIATGIGLLGWLGWYFGYYRRRRA
jgi:hypothetical protein